MLGRPAEIRHVDPEMQAWLESLGPYKPTWQTRLRWLLLMPFNCKWNAWVRDGTAWLERRF
jgi:hypothetical protein